MNILNNSLHIIDVENNRVNLVTVSSENEDLRSYVTDLLGKVTSSQSKRKFEFASDTTEVKSAIDRIITSTENFQELAEINAQRLLRVERNVQSETEHLLYEIQKGVLIQILAEIEGRKHIIFAKADHIVYLDEELLKNRNGFPIKKKIYKAFLAQFDDANLINKVFVYDTNASIAKFWWSGFLELNEVNTDEQNTDSAFDSIDRFALSKIKDEFKADHNILRNRVLGYFRAKRTFELDDFIENTIGDYEPINPRFDVDTLKNKIRGLPEKKGFDSQFNIKPEVIKAKKLKNIVPINEKIDLHINDFVDDLDEIITSYTYQGEKYIRIKTDTGYEAFKK